jgi:aryl-alcohol dehydrogenase-like predicted oxidoreductase
LALAWVLHQGNDILPLFGTTKKSRLKENIAAAEINLTPEELGTLIKIFQKEHLRERGMQHHKWEWS